MLDFEGILIGLGIAFVIIGILMCIFAIIYYVAHYGVDI